MLQRIIIIFLFFVTCAAHALPNGFVYLHDIAPDIIEEMRYASANNFIGHPIKGYKSARCIVTLQAAKQLAKAEKRAQQSGYNLKVYDCYRPQRAVNAFYKWSQDAKDTRMKNVFYPREDKATLFNKGYIAKDSGHTRGSTVDISLVKINSASSTKKKASSRCYGKTNLHSDNNSFNTGTNFDCFDISAHVFYPDLSAEQKRNRLFLRNLMIAAGFNPYGKEWWHFTLKNEPYPHTYFDFQVR